MASPTQIRMAEAVRRHQAGDLAAAATTYRAVLAREPNNADAQHLLGLVLCQQGDAESGTALLRRAVVQRPGTPHFRMNLGKALHDLGRWDEAEEHYRAAITLRSGYGEALYNLGRLTWDRGQIEPAGALYEHAIAAGYDARLNLAQIRLLQGRFAEGWPLLNARWRPLTGRMAPPPRLQVPFWDGSALTGRRLLVWGEQGIGDEILFCRGLVAAAQAATTCIYECDPRLRPLLARSLPQVRIVGRTNPSSLHAGEVDVQTPLFELGHWLWRNAEAVSPMSGYLVPDAALHRRLRLKYRAAGKPVVGISWSSRNPECGAQRSLALDKWAPLLTSEAHFVSLQYGADPAELAACGTRLGTTIHRDPEIDALSDLDAFAAQVAAMDAVVTIDNSTVHFAGALGIPTAVLVPLGAGNSWYWPPGRQASLWYSSVHTIQQRTPGDWEPAIADACQWLATELNAHSAHDSARCT